VLVAATAFTGFIATIPMRYLYRKLWFGPVLTLAAGMLLTSYVIAFGWRWMQNLWYWDWVKGGWRPEGFMGHVSGVMGSFYIMLCWSGLYFGIKYYQRLQEQTEQTLKATAAAHQSQSKTLRYQLNPHFLFSTLNAISTLILDGANETANQAVSRLSDFLRYTLDNDPMKRVTLGSEFAAIDLYLEIEKVRFGDRLNVPSLSLGESRELVLGENSSAFEHSIDSHCSSPRSATSFCKTPAFSSSATSTPTDDHFSHAESACRKTVNPSASLPAQNSQDE
jgi:two-component system, LytTR family, sensor kinase